MIILKSQTELNVVFVHLGRTLPKYLVYNMDRFKKLFPTISFILILNDRQLFLYCKEKNIPVFLYENHDSLLESYLSKIHNTEKFRSNFWRFALERIFAILSFHDLNPNKSILHIESDVLVLPNFPWETVLQSKHLMWNSYSLERDIASLFYSPSVQASRFLEAELKNYFTFGTRYTDMSILRLFSINHPDKMIYFNSSKSEFLPLKFSRSMHLETNHSRNRFLDSANGVFDSAANGIWLTGQSVENNFGVLRLHHRNLESSAEIDPSDLEFTGDSNSNIFITYNGKIKPLYSLHIHSKNEKLFGPSWERELSKYIQMSKNRTIINRFKLRKFINLILINYRRRELFLFCKLLIMHIMKNCKTKRTKI